MLALALSCVGPAGCVRPTKGQCFFNVTGGPRAAGSLRPAGGAAPGLCAMCFLCRCRGRVASCKLPVASCSKFLARARRGHRVMRRSPCPPHPAGERRGRLSSLPTANCLLYFCFWALPAPRRPRGPRPGAPASGRGPSRSPWSSGQPAGRRCHSGAGRLSVNQRSVLEAVFGPCRHQPPVDRGRGRGPGRRHIRAWPRPGPLATAERPFCGGIASAA